MSATLKVLRSMTLKTFRLKAFKAFKLKPSGAQMRLWLTMNDGGLAELDSSQDTYDLTWWGLEDGAEVYSYIEQ
jgi:hypothetical protein